MAKKTNFTKEFLEQVKQILLQEKTRLEAELGKFTKKNPHISDEYDATFQEYGNKDDENALEVAQYITDKPLEETLEKELRDVKKSLERLEKGSYGVCKYCEKPIDEKRLLARPTSSACIECKKILVQEA